MKARRTKNSPRPSSECNVTVAVRVRPVVVAGNRREEGEQTSVSVEGNSVTIVDPSDRARGKRTFTYDYAFDSLSPSDTPSFASQLSIFNTIGQTTLSHAFQGYNACIFAYGQTSSGKTYTMFGLDGVSLYSKGSSLHEEVGLIPRICLELFEKAQREVDSSTKQGFPTSYRVEVSNYEVYNERVYDLLGAQEHALKVREHPSRGPYVEGLQKYPVKSYTEIERYLKKGAKSRHTASTLMNDHSSRSHAVCEVVLTASKFDPLDGDIQETSSKLELVDLAGSERSAAAGTEGERLKEGANINKSLLTLGNVIETLASKNDKRSKARFVQYRDSTLTWLLREALGGNSRTVMMAALSPSALNYEESLSTLKYADRAKKIKNMATINRDSKKAIILHLREEIAMLRAELEKEQLHPRRRSITHMEESLNALSISQATPYLLQVQPLPALHDAVVYWLEKGATYISCADHTDLTNSTDTHPNATRTIQLPNSRSVDPHHALLVNNGDEVVLQATYGAPYTGDTETAVKEVQNKVIVDDCFIEPQQQAPLSCGTRIRIGMYEFLYCDPENVDEIISMNHAITKMERRNEARTAGRQKISKRVQRILSDGGVVMSELEPDEQLGRDGSYDGEIVLVRTPLGPTAYVWNQGEGVWDVGEDTFQAEIAAMHIVDQSRRKTAVARRFQGTLGDELLNTLPSEKDLGKPGKKDQQTRLVKSPRTGVKVVQWDKAKEKWVRAPDAVAEQSVQEYVERHRSASNSKATASKVVELQGMLATYAEEAEQKDTMLEDHKNMAAQELARLRDMHEQQAEEWERKELEFQNIREVLERNIQEAEYQRSAADNMHELCLAAKDKAISKMTALQSEYSTLEIEYKGLKGVHTELQEEQATWISEKASLEEKLRRAVQQESPVPSPKPTTEQLSTLESTVKTLNDSKTQAEDNLRRLSQQYTQLKQLLLERESRLSNYRELLEEKEAAVANLEAKKQEHLRNAEGADTKIQSLKQENASLQKKAKESCNAAAMLQLQKRLEVLEADLEKQKSKGQFGDKKNIELSGQKSHLQNQIKMTLERCNTLKRQLEEGEAQLEASRNSEKTLREEVVKLTEQLKVFKQGRTEKENHMQLSIRLELAERENVRLQNDLSAHRKFTKEMMEGGQQKLKEELAAAKTALSDVEGKAKTLDSKLHDAKSRAERERTAREAKDDEINYLKQELHVLRLQEKGDKMDMSRRTNPFGTHVNPTDSKKTPREAARRMDKKTPSYMKKTANWSNRTDEPRGTSPVRTSDVPSMQRSNSKGKLK